MNLSAELQAEWVGKPVRFSERLSAHLWATHQIDDFSRAAEEYIRAFNTAVPEPAAAPRLGIAVGAEKSARPIIRYFASCGEKVFTSPMSLPANNKPCWMP